MLVFPFSTFVVVLTISLPVILFSLLVVTCAVKDYGIPGWTCDEQVMKKWALSLSPPSPLLNLFVFFFRSVTVPKSVHSLRFADINVIGAIGDSITVCITLLVFLSPRGSRECRLREGERKRQRRWLHSVDNSSRSSDFYLFFTGWKWSWSCRWEWYSRTTDSI